MERIWAKDVLTNEAKGQTKTDLLEKPLDSDDDRSLLSEEEQERLESEQVEEITLRTAGPTELHREKSLLAEMASIAENGRGVPDARVLYLIDWIRKNMCLGVRLPGTDRGESDVKWSDLRVLIFTEYDDTLRYIHRCVRSALEG